MTEKTKKYLKEMGIVYILAIAALIFKVCKNDKTNDFYTLTHPVETWKKLIDDAHDAGMIYASLTGGECLTYPGFDDVYLYLRTKGIVPGILSNGLLMNEKRVQFLKKYRVF